MSYSLWYQVSLFWLITPRYGFWSVTPSPWLPCTPDGHSIRVSKWDTAFARLDILSPYSGACILGLSGLWVHLFSSGESQTCKIAHLSRICTRPHTAEAEAAAPTLFLAAGRSWTPALSCRSDHSLERLLRWTAARADFQVELWFLKPLWVERGTFEKKVMIKY